MAAIITLHVFSGRPDPTWLLEDDQARELTDRVYALKEQTPLKAGGSAPGLGFRGFTVSSPATSRLGQMRLAVHEGVVDPGPLDLSLFDRNREIEKWLLGTAGDRLAPAVRQHVESALAAPAAEAVERRFQAAVIGAPAAACPVCQAADAPAYNPGAWNIPSVQPYNNCYNYANNQITNTFAQPGKAHGAMYTDFACGGEGGVQPAAQADGLVPTADFHGTLGPGQGWYVALVIWPDNDFHWYRQDSVGCWSHKPGETAVRNVDNSGNPITDPLTCDRGPYTSFCAYMITTKNVVIK